MAAFSATALKGVSAKAGFAPNKKTMCFASFSFFGLVCNRHARQNIMLSTNYQHEFTPSTSSGTGYEAYNKKNFILNLFLFYLQYAS